MQPSAEKTDCLGGEKDVPYQAGRRTRFRALCSTLLHLPRRAIWQRGAASSAAPQRWVRWAGSKPWVRTGGCHKNSLREPTECVALRSPKRSTDRCHFPQIGSHMAPIIIRPMVRSQYLPPGFGASFVLLLNNRPPAALLHQENGHAAHLWSGIQVVADHSRRLDPGFPEQQHRVPEIRKSLEYHGLVRLTVPKDPRWRGRLTIQSQRLQSFACRPKRSITGLAFTPAALIRPRLAICG